MFLHLSLVKGQFTIIKGYNIILHKILTASMYPLKV